MKWSLLSFLFPGSDQEIPSHLHGHLLIRMLGMWASLAVSSIKKCWSIFRFPFLVLNFGVHFMIPPTVLADVHFSGCYLARTAMTKPQIGGLNSRHLFPHSSRGWRPKMKVPAGLISGEPPILACRQPPCHYVLGWPFLCEHLLLQSPPLLRTSGLLD